MNIEELFDNEKWAGYGIVVTDDANLAIDYLKTEVMEYIAGLEKQIAEHEAEFNAATERFWEEIASSYCKGYLEGSASNKRITELEKELAEEARLNGMGAEREAKLLARVAELEEQNLNMMALFRDFYELEFNRDECWEIIKKYGGDA